MRKRAIKKCRGNKDAVNFGCGYKREIVLYGLCEECKKEFIKSSQGEVYLHKFLISKKKNDEKAKKQERRKEKEEIKKKSDYEKILQDLINNIVHLIDIDKKCVSCNYPEDGIWNRQKHAGHFHSVGQNATLRFNLHNIHIQDSICNNFHHANEKGYIKGLISRYGIDYFNEVELLPQKYKELHLTKEDLKEAIKQARFVRKELLSGKDFTRDEINDIIGIYK